MSLRSAVRDDVEEVLRLAGQVVRTPGTRLNAAIAGHDHPLSITDLLIASVYSAWTGQPHPLVPTSKQSATPEIDVRLADLALQNMNT